MRFMFGTYRLQYITYYTTKNRLVKHKTNKKSGNMLFLVGCPILEKTPARDLCSMTVPVDNF